MHYDNISKVLKEVVESLNFCQISQAFPVAFLEFIK